MSTFPDNRLSVVVGLVLFSRHFDRVGMSGRSNLRNGMFGACV